LIKTALFLSLIILIPICAFAGVNRDSLQIATADELQDKLFRGEILVHFPMMLFPVDSAGGDVTWFPVPEMGFRFTPTINFGGGWFAFPIRVMGMFPFADDWAALGDASAGCEVHVPPVHAGVQYRFMRGKIYPVKGDFYAHIVGIDLGIPVDMMEGTGVALDWIIYTKLEIGRTFTDNGVTWDYYDGNLLTLSPYWRFSPGDYGEITLKYRLSLLQNLKGHNDESQAIYDVGNSDFSLFEFSYVYP
jgi:hypothetical protein